MLMSGLMGPRLADAVSGLHSHLLHRYNMRMLYGEPVLRRGASHVCCKEPDLATPFGLLAFAPDHLSVQGYGHLAGKLLAPGEGWACGRQSPVWRCPDASEHGASCPQGCRAAGQQLQQHDVSGLAGGSMRHGMAWQSGSAA